MGGKYEWFVSLTPNGLVLDSDRVAYLVRTNQNYVMMISDDAKKAI